MDLSEDLTTVLLRRDNQEVRDLLQKYRPEREGVTRLRVLLYGPVGSGKSSFINSAMTSMRGQVSSSALGSAANTTTSFTKKVGKDVA